MDSNIFEFEKLYKNIIFDPQFIQNLIDNNTFENWIRIDPKENQSEHLVTLSRLVKTMEEFELYEHIPIVLREIKFISLEMKLKYGKD